MGSVTLHRRLGAGHAPFPLATGFLPVTVEPVIHVP